MRHMDFSNFTQKAKDISKKWLSATLKAKNDALSFTERNLKKSRYIIKNREEFTTLRETSRQKTYKDPKTWVVKNFTRNALLFVCGEESDFTRNLLFKLPLIFAKSFSQDMHFALMIQEIEGIDVREFQVQEKPALILFEDTAVKKVIHWEENIQKVVNSLSLDINTTIHEL